jgi:colanic acid biosynthesis glycosyl transferase WcaI
VSDKIVVIGEMMRSYLTGRLGIRNDKVIVIHDWADTDCIIPVPQANEFSIEKGLAGKFVVMHSGRVGLLQDLELLLECARDMRDIPDLRFVIAGEGVNRERLMKTASEMGLKNVLFIPFQPEETLKYSLGSASVGIILFKDDYSHCLVPSRLYCHLASQRPIIATASDSSDLKVMIDRANAGIVIPPGRKDALKNAIEELYRNRERLAALGRNARDFVIKNYSRSRMTEKYMDMLLEIEKYGRQNIRQGT